MYDANCIYFNFFICFHGMILTELLRHILYKQYRLSLISIGDNTGGNVNDNLVLSKSMGKAKAWIWMNMLVLHDDVIKWKHFPRNWPLCGEFTGPGEFPTQRPVTRSFDVLFDLRPNKRLSKQWRGWWFETLSRPFWRHRNEVENA